MSENIQDQIRIFHEDCGGIVIGQIGGDLRCTECGCSMSLEAKPSEPSAMALALLDREEQLRFNMAALLHSRKESERLREALTGLVEDVVNCDHELHDWSEHLCIKRAKQALAPQPSIAIPISESPENGVRHAAREHVDKQLAVMEKYGDRPTLTSAQYEKLIDNIVLVTARIGLAGRVDR